MPGLIVKPIQAASAPALRAVDVSVYDPVSREVCSMTFLKSLSLALLAVASVSMSAFAEDKKDTPPLPAPLQNLVAEGAQIRYLGRENNLDGWVTIKQGQEQYFYVTPDQQSIMMGILFNAKGDVVTLRQVNELRKKEGPALDVLAGFPDAVKSAAAPATADTPAVVPDFTSPKALMESANPSKSEQLYQAVSSANWLALGNKDAPAIYSFIDPECPHCHDLIQDVRKSGYLEKGLVQLRLLPVGLISEESLQEAAFLLAAPNATELLYQHLDGKKGVLLGDPNINTQGVQRNMTLMQDWKFDVTPFSIYKDTTGKVKILRGRPNDLKKVVAELR